MNAVKLLNKAVLVHMTYKQLHKYALTSIHKI